MAFDFTCPRCGATSRTDETAIGQSGPCFHCGETVTVFPPSGLMQPPAAGWAAAAGAMATGAFFFFLMFALRSLPLWITLNATGLLMPRQVFEELVATITTGVIGLAIGAVVFFTSAAIVNTRRAFLTIRRGVLIGAALGSMVGLAVGITLAMSSPNAAFFVHGELVGTAVCCGSVLLGILGGIAALPIAAAGERRLVEKAAFIAPDILQRDFGSKDTEDEPVLAEVAPSSTRPELTSQRRQELIRRLRVVHDATSDDAGPTDAATQQDSETRTDQSQTGEK